MTTTISIVYGVDNRFAIPLAASIESALDGLGPGHTLDIYVIDGGLSSRNRLLLTRSFAGRACTLSWLAPSDRRLATLKVGGSITVATYYRLLIPGLLRHASKAIYLDADVIVRGDLALLWQVPMGDRLLLAVQDQGVRTISGPFGLTNYKQLGIPESTKYFNAGVLVLDLERWRTREVAEAVVRYVGQNATHIRFHDQDGMNAMLWRDWGELDPRWNQMPQLLQIASSAESPFDPDTFRRARESPYIVHYASSEKPWRYGCRHPATNLFFKYLDRTAFRGFRPSWLRTRLGDALDSVRKRAGKLATR